MTCQQPGSINLFCLVADRFGGEQWGQAEGKFNFFNGTSIAKTVVLLILSGLRHTKNSLCSNSLPWGFLPLLQQGQNKQKAWTVLTPRTWWKLCYLVPVQKAYISFVYLYRYCTSMAMTSIYLLDSHAGDRATEITTVFLSPPWLDWAHGYSSHFAGFLCGWQLTAKLPVND